VSSVFTTLRLRNFKSWRDTGQIRLAPVTAFFGTNSSGKTSILQSLLLLTQTADSSDRGRVLDLGGPTALVDLGTFDDILWNHDHSNQLSFALTWRVAGFVQVDDPARSQSTATAGRITSSELGIESCIDDVGGSPSVAEMVYRLGRASFAMRRQQDRRGYELHSDDYAFVRVRGRPPILPAPDHFYGFPDQVRASFQNASFLSNLEFQLEEKLARIRYLGPLRVDPKRQYTFSGGAPRGVGRRGEFAVDALIAARQAGERAWRGWTVGGVHRRRLAGKPLDRLVAEWLQELGLIDSFQLEPIDDRETLYRVGVRRSAGSAPVLLTDVGFGVSQVLPVLVALARARAGDTVILEQPEIHLHPAVQSGLADVIIETALTRDVQILVESHSEHLLTRLQRRLAEADLARGLRLTPSDVALYFCDQHKGESESRISRLEIDEFGNISNWPEDFFGNPLEDAVAMVEAAARRASSGEPTL
jgi:hypothetical protein